MEIHWISLIIIFAIPMVLGEYQLVRRFASEEYCNREKFNATCSRGEAVVITSASYGRMRMGRCATHDLGYVGCSVDVLDHMETQCSGRRQCVVDIPDDKLYAMKPCPKDITSYLQAAYACVKLSQMDPADCHRQHKSPLSSSVGYFSSELSTDLPDCPWRVRAADGQRINLTITLFLLESSESRCYKTMLVSDGAMKRSFVMCPDKDSRRHVYLSSSNAVDITVPHLMSNIGVVLVKYEVIGCPNIRRIDKMWVQVTGKTATLKCNHTGETWHVTCKGNAWVGQMGKCIKDIQSAPLLTGLLETTFPFGVVIAVCLGVALGVLIGGLLLAFTVALMNRRRRRNRANRASLTSRDDAPNVKSGEYRTGISTMHFGVYKFDDREHFLVDDETRHSEGCKRMPHCDRDTHCYTDNAEHNTSR